MDSSNIVFLKGKLGLEINPGHYSTMVMKISCRSPAVFMCTEKHFCSLQWGHQLRRALSITQFPFPAKGNTSQRALYHSAILNYHISPNIRRLLFPSRRFREKTQKIYTMICNKKIINLHCNK